MSFAVLKYKIMLPKVVININKGKTGKEIIIAIVWRKILRVLAKTTPRVELFSAAYFQIYNTLIETTVFSIT